jgi:hypothetical protein
MIEHKYIPYVYTIGWIKLNKYYIGVKHAKGCHPNKLFNGEYNGYYTSSKVVNEFMINGMPDYIEIEEYPNDPEGAIEREYELLLEVNAASNGVYLNKTSGRLKSIVWDEDMRLQQSIRTTGRLHTDNTKLKMSKARRGKKKTEEHKKNISKSSACKGKFGKLHPAFNRTVTEETKILISKKIKLYYLNNPQEKENISKRTKGKNNGMYGKVGKLHPGYGKKRTIESRKKMSIAQIGKKLSEETKQKLREINRGAGNGFYGKKHTEETKQKLREAHRKRANKKIKPRPNAAVLPL